MSGEILREMHSFKCLYQTRKIHFISISFPCRKSTLNQKVFKRDNIKWIRREINDIGNRQIMAKIKIKIQLLKPSTKLIISQKQNKIKKGKLKISSQKKMNIATDLTDIKEIIKKYYEKCLPVNTANLDDMAKFLKNTVYETWLKNSLDLPHFH